MFGFNNSNPIEDMLTFHSNFDRFFNQFWNDLPARVPQTANAGVHVRATEDAWKVSVPMPGIDPKHVALDASGTRLTIRAEQPEAGDMPYARFEQTITVPSTVDMDKVTAAYRYGVLDVTLPWKESIKPRRIQIETSGTEQKQLHAVAS